MNAMIFDTLSFANRRKSSGFDQWQTEALAHEYLTSKLELLELRLTLALKLGAVKVALGSVLIAIKYLA